MQRESKVISSLSWMGGSHAVKFTCQLVCYLILARIIGPVEFGYIAIVGSVVIFANLYKDFGTAASIIYSKYKSTRFRSTVFWFNIFTGFILSLSIYYGSSLISVYFSEPKIERLLASVAPVFILSSVGVAHQAILEKKLRFAAVAKIEMTAAIVALFVAVLSATEGAGAYAYILYSIALAATTSLLMFYSSGWKPTIYFSLSYIKKIWSYSANIFIFSVLNYFHRNVDSILIGRFHGMADLGIYNIAYKMLMLPLSAITMVVSRVIFAEFCSIRNKEAIGRQYILMLSAIAYFIFPCMAIIWALREMIVNTLLGKDWLMVSNLIAWFAPLGAIQALIGTSGSALNSVGRSDVLRNLGLIGVPFLMGSIVFGLRWGIEGVAISYTIANCIWAIPVFKVVLFQLGINLMQLDKRIYIYALISAVLALVIRRLYFFLSVFEINSLLLGVGAALLFSFSYVILTFFYAPKVFVRLLKRMTKV